MGGFSSGNWLSMGTSAAMALMQGQQRQQSDNAQREAQLQGYDLQEAALQRQQAQQMRERDDLLRRTLATQRARLSAMGMGAGDGSAGALMAGLTRTAAKDVADIEGQYQDRLAQLDLRRQQLGAPTGSGEVLASALTPFATSLLSNIGTSRRGATDDFSAP
ncbi:MAG: hypothetical protein ACM3Q1_09390 [Bacteroidales bacterium]